MNLELLREIMRGSRYFVVALLLAAALDAGLYGYRAMVQEPELEKAQKAYFSARATGGDGATQRTVQYQNGMRDLAQFQERLIPKRDFARFLDSLFSLAERHSLTVKAIGYKPGTEKGPVVSYGMNLGVSGKYAAIKAFVAELSRYPQMVTVDQLSLKNSSTTEEAVDLQLQMTAFLKTEGA